MAAGNGQPLENLDVWTSALLTKSSAGRGGNGKLEAYGIKKLRELILELAVRGKLVPQDPNDESARELLKRVAADKAKMVNEGKIRKEKDFPVITGEEVPFNVPGEWEWARINDVGHDWGQKTPDAKFTYIDVSAIDNSSGVISSPSLLSAADAPSRARKIVAKGTVIYSTVRPYLKNICVIEEEYSPEAIASTAFAVLHPFQGMPGKFFALYFRSPEFVKYVEKVQTGIAYPAINDKQFYGGFVPIPPLAEQRRIVAKVDELMALCDQLEQQQTDSIAAHQTLVASLLGTLTRVESPQEFSAAWARIASRFDTLFTTEASIDQLKQTILQLAVMGKLVQQDPSDEPASELLNRIAKKRARMEADGTGKKSKSMPVVREGEQSFVAPCGWVWSRLQSAFDVRDGTHDSPKFLTTGVPVLTSKNIYGGKLDLSDLKFISESDHIEFSKRSKVDRDDILFAMIGSIGNPVIVNTDLKFSFKNMALFKYFSKDLSSPQFLQIFLSVIAEDMKAKAAGGVQSFVALGTIRNQPIALPPLQEQHRIVAKVDELMVLCDALMARLADAQTIQLHLADAIVEQAVC